MERSPTDDYETRTEIFGVIIVALPHGKVGPLPNSFASHLPRVLFFLSIIYSRNL